MAIQWFPGHMTKARRQIEDKLKLIDVTIELLDSRLPLSSRNPMIDDILRDKPRLIILNKSDLADAETTRRWLAYFKGLGYLAHPVDAATGTGIKEIPEQVKLLLKEKIDRQLAKGINPRAMRALIVGIPNVGKSTLINRMAGRNIAATGDRPGVTKGQQWIKTGGNLELLDTPGILWPKFEDQAVGYKLAITGAIREEILNIEDIAFYAVKYMLEDYGDRFKERFGIEKMPTDPDNADEIIAVMEAVGRKRGCLVSGGRVDLEKASRTLLHELRAGKLGRFSLEAPHNQ